MRPASTSHSASTPPPWPPTAGIRTESTRASVMSRKGPRRPPPRPPPGRVAPATPALEIEPGQTRRRCRRIRSRRGQTRDDGATETREQPPPLRGILHGPDFLKRRAEHGGVRDLAADA